MAKDAKPAAADAGDAPPKKKSKKLLIIILAVVLLLVLAGGGAAFFLLKKSDHEEDGEDGDEHATQKDKEKDKKKKKDPKAVPAFIALEPFTVNLIPEAGDQYLQIMMTAELEDAKEEAALKGNLPKIRNNLTLLLSGKKASELLQKEGKEKLAEELKDEINMVIDPPVKNRKGQITMPDGPVKAVLFTSFIIQ